MSFRKHFPYSTMFDGRFIIETDIENFDKLNLLLNEHLKFVKIEKEITEWT